MLHVARHETGNFGTWKKWKLMEASRVLESPRTMSSKRAVACISLEHMSSGPETRSGWTLTYVK